MKRSIFGSLLFLILAILLAIPVVAAPAAVFPDNIPLPDGFRPEGIAVGRGSDFFTGSLADGRIYKGDLKTGEGDVLVPGQAGRLAVGMSHDDRSNYLFVAGGLNGTGRVYDAGTGDLIDEYPFTAPFSGFVNDVIVTRNAAYFTDSFRPFLYKVPLGPKGALSSMGDWTSIPLGGDIVFGAGFNVNGIEATSNGKWLVVVHSSLGLLFRVDPETGYGRTIDLGGAMVPAGDGLLLDDDILYVVQNQLNQIAVFQLDEDLNSGNLLDIITDPGFRVPTTVAGFGDSLYAVNARFGIPDPGTADFDAVKVSKYGAGD